MNIKYIKLNNGEDIIANISDNRTTDIEVTEPIKIEYFQHSGAGVALSFTEWIIGTEKDAKIVISKNSILTMINISDDLTNYYKRFIMNRQVVMTTDKESHEEYDDDDDEYIDDEFSDPKANTETTYH